MKKRELTMSVALRFPVQLFEEVDAITINRADQPNRSVVIRELVAEALDARRKRRATEQREAA